jgi:hypothetical protein
MGKRKVTLIVILGIALVLGFAFILKPHMEMTELAQETCDELDGAIVMVAGSIMSGAIGKADRLGFSAAELGDKMRVECPDLMAGLAQWSADHGGK